MVCLTTYGQEQQGIVFFEGTYEAALEKAKQENRLVFIDCYADWCGPCFKMAKEVFTIKRVGDFFNQHFISLKCNMEKNEAGRALKKRFDVVSYPTLLFVSPEGFVTQRRGGFLNEESLLAFAQKALDAGIQSDEQRFVTGDRDQQFLKRYLKSLLDSHQADAVEEMLGKLYAEQGITLLEDGDYWTAFVKCAIHRDAPLTCGFTDAYGALCKVHGSYAVDQKVRNIYASFAVVLSLYDTQDRKERLNETRKEEYIASLKERNLPGYRHLQQEVEYLVRLKEKDYQGAYEWGQKCLKRADARVLCNWAAWGERIVRGDKELRTQMVKWADRAIAEANGNTEIVEECNHVKRDLLGSVNPVISFKGKNARTTIPIRGY